MKIISHWLKRVTTGHNVLYAFYFCDDPESGGSLISLHYSEANANKAMEWHKQEYIKDRELKAMKHKDDKYVYEMYTRINPWTYWSVEPVKVEP